ncbi:MAG: transglycosylase SLT domain-containing protein [Psychromonas sp.]
MKRIILVICAILFSSMVLSLSLSQQRLIYSEAKSLQGQQRWDEAAIKMDSIPRYPLTYLLEYQILKSNLSQDNLSKISTFIEHNKPHWASYNLQRKYLYYLAKNQYWDDFITFYPQLPRSPSLKCFYFQAKMSQGKAQSIWPDVKKMWLKGWSRPNACNVVFNYYLKKEMISQELILQRFKLAHINNKKPLMKYLITLLQGDNKQLTKQIYTLYENPRMLPTSTLFSQKEQASYPFLKPSIKRLARSDIAFAVQTYQNYEQKIPFTANDKVELEKYLLLRILIRNRQELLPWFDETLLSLADVDLMEHRIRYAIKYNNWQDIEFWVKKLPQETAQKNRWVYWQARVLEERKEFKEANKLYQKIAGYRKYYSFLAAQKLGLSYQLNAKIVEHKVASLDDMQAQLDHIEELSFHQYNTLIKREWVMLLQDRADELQRQLGLYAFDKGWSHLSVLASVRSKSWDAINIRFPEAKPKLFSENALKYQIPASYLYAIARQESSLDQFANSPVGATGYMQLMPQTAKETARKIGLKNYKRKAQLTEGEINVQLGTAYFTGLLKRYDGNRILATAAYNAGPHRVDRWKRNKKGRDSKALSMDSWVETIPYKETRRYVKNVLAYNVIYQHVLQKPMEFFNKTELAASY